MRDLEAARLLVEAAAAIRRARDLLGPHMVEQDATGIPPLGGEPRVRIRAIPAHPAQRQVASVLFALDLARSRLPPVSEAVDTARRAIDAATALAPSLLALPPPRPDA